MSKKHTITAADDLLIRSTQLRDAGLLDNLPNSTPNKDETIHPKRSSHVGIKVWNVVKKIFDIIRKNLIVCGVASAIIAYLIIVILSKHNIKPTP
jgi:hypothetical protein